MSQELELVPPPRARHASFAVRAIGDYGLDAFNTVIDVTGPPERLPAQALELAGNLMRKQFPFHADTVRCWVVTHIGPR